MDQVALAVNKDGNGFYRVILPQVMIKREYPSLTIGCEFSPMPIEIMQSAKSVLFQWMYADCHYDYIKFIRKHVNPYMVYEIDDLYTNIPKENYHYNMMPKDLIKRVRQSMDICDAVVTTTDPLAEEIRKHVKIPVYVAPNGVPSEHLITPAQKVVSGKIRVGWHGSLSHGPDLDIIADVVRETKDLVRWVFMGIFPQKIMDLVQSNQVEFHRSVPIDKFYAQVSSLNLDIGIAPLVDHPFNHCKSDLKILEYGALGIPVIATDITPYRKWKEEIVLVKNRHSDWVKAIMKMAGDVGMRYEKSLALHNAVKEKALAVYNVEKFMGAWGLDYPDKKASPYVFHKDDDEKTGHAEITGKDDPLVTVFIPAWLGSHEAIETTQRCIQSVADSKNNTRALLFVHVDGLPQDRELMEKADELIRNAYESGFTVEVDSENHGFPHAVNEGSKSIKTDFILLNSDTVVCDGWIDGIMLGTKEDKVASVTPLSNNGELASYPNLFQSDNDFIDPSLLPAEKQIIEMPVGVGFCMWINRKVWEESGGFDEELFPEGYGEETYWCLKTGANGYKHYLSANSYVWHDGSKSYGSERKKRLSVRAMDINKTKFPGYVKELVEIPKKLLAFHRVTDLAVNRNSASVLFVGHTLGGGSEKWMQNMIKHLDSNGMKSRAMRPIKNSVVYIEGMPSGGVFDLSSDEHRKSLTETLGIIGIKAIQISQLVGYDGNMHRWLDECNIPYSIMEHDYYGICPKVNMFQNGEFCGAPDDPMECQRCLKGSMDIHGWRNMHEHTLSKAIDITIPSESAAQYYRKYFKDIRINVIGHDTDSFDNKPLYRDSDTVMILGTIHEHKGSFIVRQLIRHAHETGSKTRFVIVGSLHDFESIMDLPNVKLHGLYKEDELESIIMEYQPRSCLLPSLWPETWSYTLTRCFENHVWPVVFDIGAPAERIKRTRFGTVIPWKDRVNIDKVLDAV